jgi:hypothetical protein
MEGEGIVEMPENRWVYWIGDLYYDKIGIANNFVQRMDAINSVLPFEVDVFDAVLLPRKTALHIEKLLHASLKPWQVRGEWYAFDLDGFNACRDMFQEISLESAEVR